jgi:putative membrane protein
MPIVALALTVFVAIQHLGFAVLEGLLWQRPIGLRVFKNSPEKAATTAVLALNQGVYNVFLAAGLVFALATGDFAARLFFLCCVVVAGIVGGFTASRQILLVQAMPAALGLIFSVMAR